VTAPRALRRSRASAGLNLKSRVTVRVGLVTSSARLGIERDDETIRRIVQAIMIRRGLDAQRVAKDVGIPFSALQHRLASSGSAYAFTAGETRALANYFGVEGEHLLQYMDRQYEPPADWLPVPTTPR
jgi:hypothetical protein